MRQHHNYDFIGDIHGRADALIALLIKLGYRKRDGAWRHHSRTAFFLGDFIDRGREQLETVAIVRSMVDAGTALAVMGNHEFNACCMLAKHPERPGDTLRTSLGAKGRRNIAQHKVFLDAVEHDESLRKDLCDFFMSLPLWHEGDGYVVVHACWDPGSAEIVSKIAPNGLLSWETLPIFGADPQDGDEKSDEYVAVETLCKGLEVALPQGISYFDSDGHERTRTRVRWWDAQADTFDTAPFLSDEILQKLPAEKIPKHALVSSHVDDLIFFGHYWFRGTPFLSNEKRVCLDFSCVRGGHLCAYRFSGEKILSPENLVWV